MGAMFFYVRDWKKKSFSSWNSKFNGGGTQMLGDIEKIRRSEKRGKDSTEERREIYSRDSRQQRTGNTDCHA
jgi:hypothetical protein